jgi:hypothetical protein
MSCQPQGAVRIQLTPDIIEDYRDAVYLIAFKVFVFSYKDTLHLRSFKALSHYSVNRASCLFIHGSSL